MNIHKKFSSLISAAILAGAMILPASTALAAAPTLTLAATGDGNSVQVNVAGTPSSSVIMFYTKTNVGSQIKTLGNTDSSGNLSVIISSTDYAIASGTSVYVTVGGLNGTASPTQTWPVVAANGGLLTLTPTGVVLAVGQTSTLTVQNNSANLYLSNNSNPPIANVNVNSSGNQVTITALSNGSTVVTVCAQASSSNTNTGNSSNCASAYVTVQNSGAAPLTFSLSNVTVAPGQNVPITITGGSGSYVVLNNSNSAAFQTNINGSIITLSTNSPSGSGYTSAITVCTANMNSCSIINATVGAASTVPLGFNQTNPSVGLGQNLNVTITGGATSNTTYYVSSNTNTNAVTTSISGNALNLYGANNGTATITVCSAAGSCGALTATVNYTSGGGAIALSQSLMSLLVGQVLSVTVSGGTTPYTLSNNQGSIYQASLNGNVITLSGISAGSGSLYACSALGACATLTVVVNAAGAGVPVTFSQNNLNLNVGNVTALTMAGSGGYYASNSTNQSVASVQITGSTAVVTALAAGSTNISICQSTGQCGILSATVTSTGQAASLPAFSQTNPTLAMGQTLTETISGGSGGTYYISANTNPSVAQLSLSGNQLTISGLSSGLATVVICASANSCTPLNVTVNSAPANQPIALSQPSLNLMVGQSVTDSISGNGSYYINTNSNSAAATAQVSGTNTTVNAQTVGSTNISICQSTGQCATLTVNVSNNMPVDGPPYPKIQSFPNGQLINENGTIYIVFQNTKVGFASASAFLGLGFKFANVAKVTNSGLVPAAKVVTTSTGAHPRGSWISNGKTIYLVTPDGLIPVSTWDIFLSNGGQASFIVKANGYDLALSKLSLMTANDARLHN